MSQKSGRHLGTWAICVLRAYEGPRGDGNVVNFAGPLARDQVARPTLGAHAAHTSRHENGIFFSGCMPTLMVHPSLLAQSIGSTPARTTRHTPKLATRRYENINFSSRRTDVCPSLLARSTRSSPAPAVLWGSRARASALFLPVLPRWLCRFTRFTHSHVNFPGYRYLCTMAHKSDRAIFNCLVLLRRTYVKDPDRRAGH